MISILIRNKNEAISLDKTLKSVLKQNFRTPYEIVVVDDHSTDNSIEIANKYGCKVIALEKVFTYGYAINFGIEYCQHDIILLLSSHNILISNDFFEKLINYFEDPKVAAVRCTPIANVKQVEQSLESIITIDKNNYIHSKDWENLIIANCSAIRKKVAVEILFNEKIRSNEEKLWCLDVMEKGFSIISNIPCYFLYNKKNKPSAIIRDLTSKYQIDGIKTKSFSLFILVMIKSIPWAIKIACEIWYNTVKSHISTFVIPIKHRKGLYN